MEPHVFCSPDSISQSPWTPLIFSVSNPFQTLVSLLWLCSVSHVPPGVHRTSQDRSGGRGTMHLRAWRRAGGLPASASARFSGALSSGAPQSLTISTSFQEVFVGGSDSKIHNVQLLYQVSGWCREREGRPLSCALLAHVHPLAPWTCELKITSFYNQKTNDQRTRHETSWCILEVVMKFVIIGQQKTYSDVGNRAVALTSLL